jgi:hypothetical protein
MLAEYQAIKPLGLQAEAGHVRVDESISLLSGVSSLINARCAARYCS